MCHQAQGYLHPLYAQSFTDIGEPVVLPKSKGWLIKRRVPHTDYCDAMGPYPLFFCKNWEAVTEDIESIKGEIVSVTLVISPFSPFPSSKIQNYFDIVVSYKDHFILDTQVPLNESISKNKRRNAKRALRNLTVKHRISPNINLDDWVELYSHLIQRHNISGIRAFSRESFMSQISIPNTHFFSVHYQDLMVGGNLFFIQGDVAYAHLSAFTNVGYDLGAAYAVKWVAIQELAKSVRWIEFGGGTRTSDDKLDGLSQFKKGWSNKTEKSIFCGKILQKEIYQRLSEKTGSADISWFPSYRVNEY